ncbi:hypothetical protein GUJ93_ZPchr0014g46692 [Zizania palustris]|uniref:Myb/SANT-like DNA-binding domain-containing protein n=1 Tax=Zizania palustris TaxID=103762 RepID=A0A8J5VRX8_ZIZPA|nr:hypothetical protein GUJ93_ZPchr0014g46692 [Zizania palustris]
MLSMCVSVTNVMPNFEDQDKISGYIVDKNMKKLERFEFDKTMSPVDVCNKLWEKGSAMKGKKKSSWGFDGLRKWKKVGNEEVTAGGEQTDYTASWSFVQDQQIEAISTKLPMDKSDLKTFFPKAWCDEHGDRVINAAKKEFEEHIKHGWDRSSCRPAGRRAKSKTASTAGRFLRSDPTCHGAGPSHRPGPSQPAPPGHDQIPSKHDTPHRRHRRTTEPQTRSGSPSDSPPPFPDKNPQFRRPPPPSRSPRPAATDDDDASSPSASPSPSPSSSPVRVASALPVADPVTVAAAPPTGLLALALPIKKHAASPNPGGGREDAWSDDTTSSLIDAWGERFVALGRGSLRHPQWQEVADAVSSLDGYSKAPRSDLQCKNRIDTLKKKYKIERAKPVSSWQFFDRLDELLAPTFNQKPGDNGGSANMNGRNPVPAALRVGSPQRSRTPLVPATAAVKRMAPSPEPSASSESSDGFPPEPPLPAPNAKRRRTDEGSGDGSGSDRAQSLRELAQAIRRFGEAYERVETAKLEQSVEMERQRLDFASELESQRVEFFLNTQMELSQVKDHSSTTHAAAPPGATTTAGGTSTRTRSVNDAGASDNYHGRYRVSDGGRRRHQPRPRYQYHENNVAAAAAARGGDQSDDQEEYENEE